MHEYFFNLQWPAFFGLFITRRSKEGSGMNLVLKHHLTKTKTEKYNPEEKTRLLSKLYQLGDKVEGQKKLFDKYATPILKGMTRDSNQLDETMAHMVLEAVFFEAKLPSGLTPAETVIRRL